MSLTPEQIEAGWVEHDGGLCPINPDDVADAMLRSGHKMSARHDEGYWVWNATSPAPHLDIIAYRPEPKP